jgi:hypothetical protein
MLTLQIGARRLRALNGTTVALLLATASALAWAQATPGPTPVSATSAPQTKGPAAAEAALKGAERLGSGRFTAWRAGERTLISLPASALGKPLFWYTEAVSVPAGAVARDLKISEKLARFERMGNAVFVRDMGTAINRRAGVEQEPAGSDVPGSAGRRAAAGVGGAGPFDRLPARAADGGRPADPRVGYFPILTPSSSPPAARHRKSRY